MGDLSLVADERWREALPDHVTRTVLRAARPVFGRLYPEEDSTAVSSSRVYPAR